MGPIIKWGPRQQPTLPIGKASTATEVQIQRLRIKLGLDGAFCVDCGEGRQKWWSSFPLEG